MGLLLPENILKFFAHVFTIRRILIRLLFLQAGIGHEIATCQFGPAEIFVTGCHVADLIWG
jgi:hypothetical protein